MTSVLPPVDDAAGPRWDALAALATVVGSVLLGAPAGLLWAAVTPRVQVVAAGGGVRVADPSTSAFIASDAWFVAVAAAAGAVAGVLTLLLGRRAGVGCAIGLAVGGLVAAEVARRTGPLVGLADARAALLSGRDGTFELTARLRSLSALTVWPVAALVVHMLGTVLAPAPHRR